MCVQKESDEDSCRVKLHFFAASLLCNCASASAAPVSEGSEVRCAGQVCFSSSAIGRSERRC